jgi:hypothetical protein
MLQRFLKKLNRAAASGDLERVKHLLDEEVASDEKNRAVNFVLLNAVANGKLLIATLLLEHGGAIVTSERLCRVGDGFGPNGRNIWDLLLGYTFRRDHNEAAVSTLLRGMMLKGSRPPDVSALETSLSAKSMQVVRDGTRLRARIPAYLAQRRALLDEHSPLIAPLQALVCGYEEPTTTEELWATGLGEESAEL